MVAITIAGIPTNAFSTAAKPATSYLSPYFTQNWRLFAPHPISSDRTFWVRGEYLDSKGETRQSDWFDWTNVELDLIRHHFVGGRAGYITNKLIGPLGTTFGALTDEQRRIAADDREAASSSYQDFHATLMEVGDNPARVGLFLSYEYSAVRLTTAVLQALHPDVDFTAVRYRIGHQPVSSYPERTLSETDRDAARSPVSYRLSGWRLPLRAPPSEQRVFDDFLGRHR